MNVHYERQELSVGQYVYVVYCDSEALCYIRESVPRAREFAQLLCQIEPSPVVLEDVRANLSPGKEIKADIVNKLLFGLTK